MSTSAPVSPDAMLAIALRRHADEFGWIKTKEIFEAEIEGQIAKCANCGQLTDEYNEDERRHIHDACLGEWRGAAAEYASDDLRDCTPTA